MEIQKYILNQKVIGEMLIPLVRGLVTMKVKGVQRSYFFIIIGNLK